MAGLCMERSLAMLVGLVGILIRDERQRAMSQKLSLIQSARSVQ